MRILTLARDLRRRKARERSDLFVAEGVRALEELLASRLAIRGALVGPQLAQTPRGASLRAALDARGVEVAEISEREFASAADTESPQGVLAIAEIPDRGVGRCLVRTGWAAKRGRARWRAGSRERGDDAAHCGGAWRVGDGRDAGHG